MHILRHVHKLGSVRDHDWLPYYWWQWHCTPHIFGSNLFKQDCLIIFVRPYKDFYLLANRFVKKQPRQSMVSFRWSMVSWTLHDQWTDKDFYHNAPNYWDRSAKSNSAEPDQTAPFWEQSDLGLLCLSFWQRCLQTPPTTNYQHFKFKENYGKVCRCPNFQVNLWCVIKLIFFVDRKLIYHLYIFCVCVC